ncbi:MAG: DNA mismatch repair endonuclease MutL [Thermoplasmata archaeon]|nr:DNA mismatch repair endonuclease MutL [Thermoplasmata archaeon]
MTPPTQRPTPGIRRLDPATIARIAAGEVVERPASVVKELVENAYDAGATEVGVAIWQGGLTRISVLDNGSGIPADELGLAVERHATSKLSGPGGLERIATLGFRGEALASIAAVSRLTLRSRPTGAEAAHGIRVEGGHIEGEFIEGAPPGTTVDVADLFFNTPARRKFLHAPAAEQVEVTGAVGALYLAHPGATLVLESEGREVARYPRTSSASDAAVRVLGAELVGQMVEVEVPIPDGGRISGVVGRPAISRGTSRSVFFSVNGRSVASRVLAQALRRAFDDYLPRTRYPVGVIAVEIDPARIDVNVHPTKREIRITRERELGEILRAAVRSALQRAPQAVDRGARSSRSLRLDPPELQSGGPTPPTLSVPLAALPIAIARRQEHLLADRTPRLVGAAGGHPRLLLLAPIFSLYWLAASDDALVLVDQHAASERVVYEALRRDGRLARQSLVSPILLTLTARQAAVLSERRAEIGSAGFTVEPFGGDSYRIASLPVYRGRLARADMLPALLDELADGGRPTVPNGLVERTAASIACHAAVRAGDTISAEEMGRILDALYRLPDASYACPHGRPILVRLPRGRLDRWFLRSPE